MGSNVIIHGKDSTNKLSNDSGKPQTNPVFVTDNAAHVHIKASDVAAVLGQETIEMLNAATFGATLTSQVWMATDGLIDGLLHVHTSGDGLTSGNLTAYYSFDGMTAINSEVLVAFTGGGSTEAFSLGFNDYDAGADAVGFTRNIKMYPFVRFGLTSGVDSGTTTMSMYAKVVRQYG